MCRRTLASLAATWLLACGGSPPTPPPPGSLDPTFGAGGVVQLDLPDKFSIARIAVQADGKVVLAGRLGVLNAGADLLVARLNANGSLDTTFGVGGTRVVDLGSTNDFATDLALVAKGRILVSAIPGSCQAALVQLDEAGALDAGFATGGVFNLPPGSGGLAMCGWAMTVQPVDGKILLGGANGDFALARFTMAGAPDAGFGTAGLRSTDLGYNDQVFALALQKDGRLVAAGSSQFASPPYTPTAVAATRHDWVDGALDASFGTGGKYTSTLSTTDSEERVSSVVELAGGKLLLLASNGAAASPFSLLRLTSAGQPDATFGTGGRADRDYGAGLVQAGDQVYVVGTRWSGPSGEGALQRLTADGASDLAFGKSGEVTLQVGASTELTAAARQADGRIVVAGSTTTYGVTRLLVARFWP